MPQNCCAGATATVALGATVFGQTVALGAHPVPIYLTYSVFLLTLTFYSLKDIDGRALVIFRREAGGLNLLGAVSCELPRPAHSRISRARMEIPRKSTAAILPHEGA
jgi:hypothetical protein